jgi:hypothetical protein
MTATVPLLETLSDFATVALALIGIPSLLIALIQATEAKKARLAVVYIDISEDWDDLADDRWFITTAPFEGRNEDTNAARGEIILGIVRGIAPFEIVGQIGTIEDAVQRDKLEHSLDSVLSYLEDLGLLCRKGYVDPRDVFDIIGSSIAEIMEMMLPYIQSERENYPSGDTIYANSLWLYREATAAAQFSVPGYGTPEAFFR